MWGKRRIRMTPGFWHEVFLREKREAGLHRAGKQELHLGHMNFNIPSRDIEEAERSKNLELKKEVRGRNRMWV